MTEIVTKEQRNWNISRINSDNTKLKLTVRTLLHSLSYRFRLNGKVSKKYHKKGVLPSKPDIVLAKYKTVRFVHGCFWHRHEGCRFTYIPKTRTEFCLNKFNKNKKRGFIVRETLIEAGWNVKIF